jgi:hypothetical protein
MASNRRGPKGLLTAVAYYGARVPTTGSWHALRMHQGPSEAREHFSAAPEGRGAEAPPREGSMSALPGYTALNSTVKNASMPMRIITIMTE